MEEKKVSKYSIDRVFIVYGATFPTEDLAEEYVELLEMEDIAEETLIKIRERTRAFRNTHKVGGSREDW